MDIKTLLTRAKYEFEPDELSSSNVLRITDYILYKTPEGNYIFFDVENKTWSDPDYATIFKPIVNLSFCQPKQYVFRSTYLGDYLNTFRIEKLTTHDFSFLYPEYEFIVEQAVKLEIPFILTAFRQGCSSIIKNMNTTSLVKAVEMSTSQLNIFQEKVQVMKNDLMYYFIRLNKLAPTFKGIQNEIFSQLCDIALNDRVSNNDLEVYDQLILSKPGNLTQKLNKVLGYINSNFREYHGLWGTLKELNHLDESEYPLLPKPDKINDLIIPMRTKIKEYENAHLFETLNARYNTILETVKKFEFAGSKFSIVCPKAVQELDVEGEVLHHCVGSYKHNVAAGQEIILFLRKNNDPNTPFYTIDLDRDGFIRQIHTKYNGDIKDDPEKDALKEFLMEWGDKKSDIVNKKSIKLSYGALCALDREIDGINDY